MSQAPPLLAFHDVSAWLGDERFIDVEQVQLTMLRGEAVFVRLEDDRDSPLPALAIGDRPIPKLGRREMLGSIAFEGIAWPDRPAHDLLACRGRIGLVLTHAGWVSNLSLLDNVLLRTLHHTQLPRRQIETRAQELAYRVGLAEVSPRRVSSVGRSERKRSEWIRAFLGDPVLVILQRPCQGVKRKDWEPLVGLVRQTLARGASVLWIASDPLESELASKLAIRRYSMKGTHMHLIEG